MNPFSTTPLTDSTSRLGLGSAQFGLDYAIDKSELRPTTGEIAGILAQAYTDGITVLDTASRYGNAEQLLGQCLTPDHAYRIVTKTPSYQKDRIGPEDVEFLLSTFQKSLSLLNRPRVYALLTHWAPDLLVPGGDRLFDAMLSLKDAGLVEKIGSSIYTAAHIDGLMARFQIDIIQVPVNLLDQRLIASGHLKELKRQGVELHARSAFMKGLVFCDIERLSDHFYSIKPLLREFRGKIEQAGLNPISACIRYLLALPEIDNVIVGVTNISQLNGILGAVSETADLPDFSEFAIDDPQIVNPNNWPKVILS